MIIMITGTTRNAMGDPGTDIPISGAMNGIAMKNARNPNQMTGKIRL
jgi:hypothetical protein